MHCLNIIYQFSVAPPPKAAIPRRTTNGHANNNGNQDLFGSDPFDTPLQPSPFDVSKHKQHTRIYSISSSEKI